MDAYDPRVHDVIYFVPTLGKTMSEGRVFLDDGKTYMVLTEDAYFDLIEASPAFGDGEHFYGTNAVLFERESREILDIKRRNMTAVEITMIGISYEVGEHVPPEWVAWAAGKVPEPEASPPAGRPVGKASAFRRALLNSASDLVLGRYGPAVESVDEGYYGIVR